MTTMTLNDIYSKVRIPEIYWEDSKSYEDCFSNMDKDSIKHVNLFLDKRAIGLFINGISGSGKTTFVSLLMKELIKRRIQCFRGDIAHFAQSFKENDWAISPKYVQPTVVAIDSVDKISSGTTKADFLPLNLERLIQYRVGNNKPVLICSSVNITELSKRLTTSIAGIINQKLLPVTLKKSHY